MALALDASTPAKATGTGATVVSPSFTAPSGALLVAEMSYNTPSNQGNNQTVTDSGGLTWTLRVRKSRDSSSTGGAGPGSGGCEVWTAVTSSSVSRTVTTTQGAASSRHCMLKVSVYTGQHATTPVGNVAAGGATSGLPSTAVTTTANNSVVRSCSSDWNQVGLGTAGTGQTMVDENNVAGQYTGHIWRTTSTVATSGTSQTMNLTAITGQEWNQCVIELVEAAGGGSSHSADASRTATATLSAAATKGVSGAASLAGAATLTAAASNASSGAASLSGTATLTAAATKGVSGSGSGTHTATLTAAAQRAASGAASGSHAATLTATAQRDATGAASGAFSATLTADATVTSGATADASRTVSAGLTAAAVRAASADTSTTVTAAFSATGTLGTSGAASLPLAATLTASADVTTSGAVTADSALSIGALLAAGAEVVSAPASRWIFNPPTRSEWVGSDSLWGRVTRQVGETVLKMTDGSFRQVPFYNPDLDGVDTVYLGGYVHTISDEAADDLTQAGYGEYLTVVTE